MRHIRLASLAHIALGLVLIESLSMTSTGIQSGPHPALAATNAALQTRIVSALPGLTLGNNLVKDVTPATQSGDFHNPLDATPDLAATTIFFTASGPHSNGIFRVPAAGGIAREVFAGDPFVAPRGIAISPNGRQLFVADPRAITVGGKRGQIFVLPVGGMIPHPSPLPGSAGTAPQNMDIVVEAGQQMIYFTGKDPSTGQPALLKLPASGDQAPTVVAEGTPFVAPDGVAVTRIGTVYVADRSAAGGGFGRVFKVVGGKITPIVERMRAGNPAGIALSPDQSLLMVSSLQMTHPKAQVLLVNLSTLQTGTVTKVVGRNPGAGGLHARPFPLSPAGVKAVYAWCGTTVGASGGSGTVFKVTLY